MLVVILACAQLDICTLVVDLPFVSWIQGLQVLEKKKRALPPVLVVNLGLNNIMCLGLGLMARKKSRALPPLRGVKVEPVR